MVDAALVQDDWLAFVSFLICCFFLFLLYHACPSDVGWSSASVLWSYVQMVDVAEIDVKLSRQSLQFFVLTPLILHYSSGKSLQVVESVHDFCELLLVGSCCH